MNRILFITTIALFLLINNFSLAQETPSPDPHLAGIGRMDLTVPDEIWNYVLEEVGFDSQLLGYSADIMANYGGSDCILPAVEMFFRDVTTIPRFGGRVSGYLLGNPEDFAFATLYGFIMLESRAGRGYTAPTGESWGVDWIEDGANIDEVFEAVIDLASDEYNHPIYSDDLAAWETLPECVKKLALRLIIAGEENIPILHEAFDQPFMMEYFNVDDLDEVSMNRFYEFASAPWQDEEFIPPRESFEALEKLDMFYLNFASLYYMTMVQGAISEFKTSMEEMHPSFEGFGRCEFNTPIGHVGIFGTGENTIDGEYALVIDLGGDDIYTGRIGSPSSFSNPISIVLDLDGDDTYDSGDESASLACGNHGIGAIFDFDGNDTYTCTESGIGCAWYGTGVVMDTGGYDNYTTNGAWGQGAAHAGVGILIDTEGNDDYYCICQSQAFGSTLGTGILVDAAGNDDYLADLEGVMGTAFGDHTVSFAQGTGYGRRADFGDGHSLGGGVGILVDGDGDDTYTAGVYSQGAGYWWALGILEDLSGNDTYTNEWYSAGSAPHFAIGCCVDFEGDDTYNIGNEKLMCQTQGCARDGSIGVFIDGSGDDHYLHSNRCAGSGDLNSIALFWDRMGNDTYTCDRNHPYQYDLSYGDATEYPLYFTFRDSVPSVGIFLDTAGVDSYEEIEYVWPEPEEGQEQPDPVPPLLFGNNIDWKHATNTRFRSFGLDTDWFTGFVEEEETEYTE